MPTLAFYFPTLALYYFVARINRDMREVLRRPAVRERSTLQGALAQEGSPESFATFLRAQTARWTKVAKESGARAE